MKNLLLAGIALVALAAPAAAADMPLKAPAPVAVDIWTGGYVGANVGYDWGSDVVNSVGTAATCTAGLAFCAGGVGIPANVGSNLSAQAATFNTSLRHSGFIYGGQAGHNWLVHNMFWTNDGVLGIEVDYQGKSDSHSATLTGTAVSPFFPANPLTATTTLNEKIQSLGTLRGRAGFLWGPNTLVYATAGLAWADARSSGQYNQFVVGLNPALWGPYGNAGSVRTELYGPVVGGGIEWKWTANWSIKVEYLYADFNSLTFNTTLANGRIDAAGLGTTASVATVRNDTHVHDNIARFGINYKFF